MSASEPEALLRAYHETIRPLFGFVARRAGGDRALAEDVTQESWLRAVESWAARGRPDDPLAWLQSVAHNLLRNHHRRLRPQSVEPGALELEELRAEVEHPQAAQLLQWGLAQLPEREARLLARRHLDGLGLAELARETGLGERALEGRLRRARKKLERRLSPHVRAEGARR